MTSTATTTAQYVATQHNRLNCSVSLVTPMGDGMELVEYVGADGYSLPAHVQALLDGARGTGRATGSSESTYSDSTGSLIWYAKRNSAPRLTSGLHVALVSLTPAQVALAARYSLQSGIPAKGDTWVARIHTGYQMVQNRSLDHVTCSCGNGTTRYAEGTVTDVSYFMDNSTEATVTLPDGTTQTVVLVAPHGDACF